MMLRNILKLFPSGIIFFNQSDGLLYKNKYWTNLLDRFKRQGFEFWRNNKHTPMKINDNQDFAGTDEGIVVGDNDTQEVLDSLYLKGNVMHTLKDEILKIYEHFYNNDYESKDIINNGVDDFILKENEDFNEYEIKDAEGKLINEFSIKFAAFKVSSEDNAIMVVLNDISEREKITKISEMLKTIMLCSISHELRTPVNQINGVLTLLLPTLRSQKQKELLRIANSSTELLKVKVNDMLDFYEVETHNFKMKKSVFNPRKAFSYIKKVFYPILDKNNLKMYFLIHEKTPEFVFHDAERIEQVLTNFVSNAVKYTKKGMICVSIDWEEDPTDRKNGTIKFSVSDTGVGIHKDRKQNLLKFLEPQNFIDFDQWKEGGPVTPKLAGTGLGISQKILNMLDSQIEFTSIENQGSVFWFSLNVNFEEPIHSIEESNKSLSKIVNDQLNDVSFVSA